MRRIFWSFLSLAMLAAFPAHSQDYPTQTRSRVDIDTVVRSVQCEMGRFARNLRRYHIPAQRLNATIVVTDKIENSSGFGFDVRAAIITLLGGVHVQNGNVRTNTLKAKKYRINADNDAACHDRNNLILADLRECLLKDAPHFAQWDIDCVSQVNVKTTASAGLTIPVSVVTIGPNASWDTTYTHAVQVTAPPGGGG